MEQRLLISMRYNTFITTVFKRHHYALDMARELFDEKGEVRSFSSFSKAVKDKVDPNYNKNWLRTEYNTAYASGLMARKWQGYVKKGGFIVYVAVMDERTRYDHANMNGARYPVDHPFWRTHYPPNGWNCRCTTRWDGTEGETVPATSIDDVPVNFQNNVGQTGMPFKDSPYFTVDGNFREDADKLFGFKPPVDLKKYEENLQLFNALSEDKNYKLLFTDNLTGGFVFKHTNADVNGYIENVRAAKLHATQRGSSVILRGEERIGKNPDLIVDGVSNEVKGVSSVNSIDNQLRGARQQALEVTLIINNNLSPDAIKRKLKGRALMSTIEMYHIVYRDKFLSLPGNLVKEGNFWLE